MTYCIKSLCKVDKNNICVDLVLESIVDGSSEYKQVVTAPSSISKTFLSFFILASIVYTAILERHVSDLTQILLLSFWNYTFCCDRKMCIILFSLHLENINNSLTFADLSICRFVDLLICCFVDLLICWFVDLLHLRHFIR